MDESTLWWVIAGVLVAVELATGTFYLLMLALGGVAGALAAHAGLGSALQIVVAALVGGSCAGGWYVRQRQQRELAGRHARADASGTQDSSSLSLDLGQTVHVTHWESDGTTHVHYRGAPWQARLQTPLPTSALPPPGTYRICATLGNQLLLEQI